MKGCGQRDDCLPKRFQTAATSVDCDEMGSSQLFINPLNVCFLYEKADVHLESVFCQTLTRALE